MSEPRHHRRSPATGRTAALVAGVALTAGSLLAVAAPATAATPSTLKLTVPTEMTGTVYDDGDGHTDTYLDGNVYLQAIGHKFELWSHRADYSSPVTTTMHRGSTVTKLPAGTTSTLAGLSNFLDVTIHDAKGRVVYQQSSTACLNDYGPVRAQPDAAAHSDYPAYCGDNPFAKGSVQGIAKGWATHLYPFGEYGYDEDGPQLAVGTYSVDVSVDAKYRTLFGISSADGRGSSTLTITKEDDGDSAGPRPAQRRMRSTAAAEPTSTSPKGARLAAAPSGPRPDLAALPAWGIQVSDDGNYLDFAATVWNAGTSPLVVDGFRKGNADVMDAYQYFYDSTGHQTGYVRAGSMEWDPRPSHNHWHFEDFARYTLVSADMKTAVVSQKEAFCLANTDAIDYTLPGANWRPDNTDLQTACGDHSSIAVSEVLATGSGDTYSQERAGQSFDLRKLKNGTYYVKVEANPAGVLSELSKANNVSLRKVTIGGTAGHRTVRVAPVGDVTA